MYPIFVKVYGREMRVHSHKVGSSAGFWKKAIVPAI
jgi:hypothetical protein